MGIVKLFLEVRIPEGVAHNAMAFGVQPSDQCEMIGEGDAREARVHILRRDTLGDERVECWGQPAVQEIGPETIKGNQDRRGCKQGCAVG